MTASPVSNPATQLLMDVKHQVSLDGTRIAQRILKFVLVPIAVFGGIIVVAIDTQRHPEEISSITRLVVASILGGLIGVERQLSGHWAGMRTHMMVGLGSAIFVIAGQRGEASGDTSRVIQGIAAGIGFLGAGTILKLSDRMEVIGLTTASSIWLAAAIGTSAGLAMYTLAVAATVLSLIVLAILLPLERRFLMRRIGQDEPDKEKSPA